MTKSTKKSDLKGKKVSVVGCRGVSRAINTYPVPLTKENSNEERESSQFESEEEASRNGGKKMLKPMQINSYKALVPGKLQ